MDVCNAPAGVAEIGGSGTGRSAAADAPAAEMKADVEQAENGVVSQLEEGVETVVRSRPLRQRQHQQRNESVCEIREMERLSDLR